MQSSTLKFALCALGLALAGFAQAHSHLDGHAKIIGKGDGLHHLHTTPQGHVAHAQVVNGKVKLVKVNVDEEQDIASRYQIMSIPTLLFFKGGKVVDQVVGAVPKSVIANKLEALL